MSHPIQGDRKLGLGKALTFNTDFVEWARISKETLERETPESPHCQYYRVYLEVYACMSICANMCVCVCLGDPNVKLRFCLTYKTGDVSTSVQWFAGAVMLL